MCERCQQHQHQHGHGHGHGHGHNHNQADFAKKNQEHFDGVANSIYQEEWVKDLCKHITEQLQRNTAWIGIQTQNGNDSKQPRLLDYACGHGVVSRALASYFPTIRGIDISKGMVAQYDVERSSAGYTTDQMRAIVGDITNPDVATTTPELSTPEWQGFDLAVISMALHHVADPAYMVKKLSDRLAPGGTLLVLDFVAGQESGDGDMPTSDAVKHTVSKHGFTEEEMKGYFEGAGLSFGWKWFDEKAHFPEQHGGVKQLVMAKGVKPTR